MSRDVGKMLSDIADGDISGLGDTGMPGIARTTSTKKEFTTKKRLWETRFFPINDDEDARNYAMFMNWVMENPSDRIIVREESSWTKDGELIRVVDMIRFSGDPVAVVEASDVVPERDTSLDDITRVNANTNSKDSVEGGRRFTPDDYVEG